MAHGWLNHQPIAADTNNSRRLAGYGVGLTYTSGSRYVQLTLSKRDGPQATSDVERSPRIWVQAVQRY